MQNNNALSLIILPLTISCLLVGILFMWQGNIGFGLADEGYLWYGVQRVMSGEIPIRDFMSYDPGRYYWSASLMRLWSDNGIMALRASVAIFQIAGLFAGLFLIFITVKRQKLIYLILSALTLALWMFPRHKLYDISLSLLLISILTFLICNPSWRRYFLTGLCVGLAAVFGRNHGMYGVVGSLGVMLWLQIKQQEGPGLIRSFGYWTAGVITGYMPVLLMILFVPGFAGEFIDGLLSLLQRGSTNLPLPVPWPWFVDFKSLEPGVAARRFLVGIFFIATTAFGILSMTFVTVQRYKEKYVSPALVAASFLSLPYAHYAFSRADINHLAQGIFPLLIGCLIILATQSDKIKWPMALTLCFASFWVMLVCHPGWQHYRTNQYVGITISNNTLQVRKSTATTIELLRNLVDQYAPDGQSFLVLPFWPGAYPLFEHKSPIRATYALWSHSKEYELKEIYRIQKANPSLVIISDSSLDGREELRFSNNHPMINKYIVDHFDQLPEVLAPGIRVFVSRR